MPVYEITRRAPDDQNSLAGYERGMGSGDFRFYQNTPSTGSTSLPSTGQQTKEEPSWLDSTVNFFQGDTFKDLLSAGMDVYGAREQRKIQEEQARRAEEDSLLRRLTAQSQQADAQKQAAMAAELERKRLDIERLRAQREANLRQEIQQPAAGGGMPAWVLPAALAGGAGLIALVLISRRKA